MITPEETAAIQEELIRLAFASLKIDLDSFLEVTVIIGSPQALAAGTQLQSVTSAAKWLDLARLLKPFRDQALQWRDKMEAAGMVFCDCNPAANPHCHLGSHEAGHLVVAVWCLTEAANEDEFMYLCMPCAASIIDGGNASAYIWRRLDEAVAN